MPVQVVQGEDGEDYERCLRELANKGDARYGICMDAYKKHHVKDGKTGKWVRKPGHYKDEKGEWKVREFAGLTDWFEIFRTGTWTDAAGNTRDWTEQDLDTIVGNYSPDQDEAPLVIGHPETGSPAYGWVAGLKRAGGVLLARAREVVKQFEDMVREGQFKKRSVRLSPDGTRLVHVGFLGATAPAVSGLKNIGFDKDEEGITVEFAATDEEKAAQKKRSTKYKIGIKEGGHVTKPKEWQDVPDDDFLDPVNYRYPCPNADQTRSAASYWGVERNQAQYTPGERSIINGRLDTFKKRYKIGEYRPKAKEGAMSFRDSIKNMLAAIGIDVSKVPDDALPEGPETKTFSEADVKAREKEAAKKAAKEAKEAAEQEFAEGQKNERIEARKAGTKAFVMALKKDGKLIPAWEKLGLVDFMLSLDGEEAIEFAEGKKSSRLDWFKDFLGELPKVINFKEIAARDQDVGGGTAGEKLTIIVREKMSKDKDLSFIAAFAEAQVEHPDLAREYQAELGIVEKK